MVPSAQYGSDAIAGVMNFRLKDNHEGGSIEFKPGIYHYGDGRQFAVAGNIGLGNPDAWSSLSFEYGGADPTVRSIQRNDAIALINAGNFSVKDPAQIWGQPIIENDVKTLRQLWCYAHGYHRFLWTRQLRPKTG